MNTLVRRSLVPAFAVLLALAALISCTETSSGTAPGPTFDGGEIDASPSGPNPAGGNDTDATDARKQADGGTEGPFRGFRIEGPMVKVPAGQQYTVCYYFRTPNTEPMAIKKWKAIMGGPAVQRVTMFTTFIEDQPAGTVTTENCGLTSALVQYMPVWTYSATAANTELALPADDGTGKPLGQVIPPNKTAFLQIHHLNTSAMEISVNVTLEAEALGADVPFTRTTSFMAYNGAIKIDANINQSTIANGGIATKTCATPPNTKFWTMSTHSHGKSTRTEVRNGASTGSPLVYENTSWAEPVQRAFAAPFLSFDDVSAPNKATFTCTYLNSTQNVTRDGDGEITDEHCVMVGFMFPATAPSTCYCGEAQCYLVENLSDGS